MISYRSATRIIVSTLFAAGATVGSAQSQWSWGHGDIGIELHGDHFHTHWGLGSGSIVDGNPIGSSLEYAPQDLVARIEQHPTVPATAPSGSLATLGIAPATVLWQAGSNAYQPNIGFSAYGIGTEDDWQGGGLTLSLSGWGSHNPGQFALYSNADGWLFSTVSALATTENNTFFLYANDHRHFAWYFTHPGYYTFDLTWTGTHMTEGLVTLTDTYGFYVIPEPATWAWIIGATASLALLVFRKQPKRS